MNGFALPVLLLLLVALTGAVHAALLLALEELRGSRASLVVLRARVEAESAAMLAGARLDDGPGPFAGSLNDGVTHTVRVTLLHVEQLLVEAEARGRDGVPSVRVGRVYWRLDPETELGRVGAGLEHSGRLILTEAGRVERGPAGGEDEEEEECEEARRLPVSRVRSGDFPEGDLFPRLGILSVEEARDQFAGARAGSVVQGGEVRPFHLPLAEGSARLGEGEWTGVLLFEGDLRVEGDAHLVGLVVVAGSLELLGDARVDGVVRVGGDVHVGGRGRIGSDPCILPPVLNATPELLRPVPLPEGSWLTPF